MKQMDKATHDKLVKAVKEARKKRENAKAFGDKVMGRKIPDSKVGNCKGGHGNFCGQSKMDRKKGNKKGGEGLARV